MSALAHAGYNQTRELIADPRNIEAQLLSQIAAEIELAAGDTPCDINMPALATAIHRNNKLWTALLTDLASDDNQLPDDLRASLISLGTYSLRHGAEVLRGDAAAKSLIDLNRSIAAGLRGQIAEAA